MNSVLLFMNVRFFKRHLVAPKKDDEKLVRVNLMGEEKLNYLSKDDYCE